MSSKRVRLGYRILHGIGVLQTSDNAEFDAAYYSYTYLKAFVEELHDRLTEYVLQLAHLADAGRTLAECMLHMYGPDEPGFRPAAAFQHVQEQGSTGYLSQLREAFVKAVIEPTQAWQREIEELEGRVADFKACRLKYDHYSRKVEDIQARLQTNKNAKEHKQMQERLNRNAMKLDQMAKTYAAVTKVTCGRLTRAWEDRNTTLNGILGRLIHFQESLHGWCLLGSIGLTKVLEGALGAKWGSALGIEPFMSREKVKHMEGALVKKGKILKTKLFFRLVGANLEAYDATESEGQAVLAHHKAMLREPREVFKVAGCTLAADTALKVQCLDRSEIVLLAADSGEAQVWLHALERAATWDSVTSQQRMERAMKECLKFRQGTRALQAKPLDAVEREMGVKDALDRPPPRPKGFPAKVVHPPVTAAPRSVRGDSLNYGSEPEYGHRRFGSAPGPEVPQRTTFRRAHSIAGEAGFQDALQADLAQTAPAAIQQHSLPDESTGFKRRLSAKFFRTSRRSTSPRHGARPSSQLAGPLDAAGSLSTPPALDGPPIASMRNSALQEYYGSHIQLNPAMNGGPRLTAPRAPPLDGYPPHSQRPEGPTEQWQQDDPLPLSHRYSLDTARIVTEQAPTRSQRQPTPGQDGWDPPTDPPRPAKPVSEVEQVFHRLCGDPSDPGGAPARNAISLEELTGWEEVRELLDYGLITQPELRILWDEAHGLAQPWTPDNMRVAGASELYPASHSLMGLSAFRAFIQLLEERQFEAEAREKWGVVLSGPVHEV